MKPLQGIKVIDLTHALAGPFCTYQLMLLGAEIIKIENPGVGDDFRGMLPLTFDAVNAGKASVTLNLKNPASLEVLERLVRDADVLVDNFKPGTADKFGITWERLQAWNERLIWCSISGFGLEGPWRDLPAVEWSVQAAAGLSDSYLAPDVDPRDLGLGVMDLSSGLAGSSAIMAALLQRARTGKGERLDVAMLDVALNLSAPRVDPAGGLARRRMGRRPAVGRFKAQDRQVFLMGAHQRWFKTISDVIGAPYLLDDPRFADPAAREENAEALRQVLEARLATRPAADWERDFTNAGMPASVVRRIDEVVASDHVRKRGVLHQVNATERGVAMTVVGPPFKFGSVKLEPSGDVPVLGQDTDAVLATAGYGAERVAEMRAAGLL
ncbi:MAG: CaiB/BaiF CoA-transferase family protein [Caulobacteraceae bacterium]